MKTKHIITLTGLVISVLTACKSDLDEVVFSDVTSSTYQYDNADAAIGIVYANMRRMLDFQDYYGVNETTSDELVMPANASGWDDGGIYKNMHLHTFHSENPQLNRFFGTLYTGVIHANRIIEQLQAGIIKPGTNATSESLTAEMRVARAFYYWLILDNYGNAPLVTTTSTELPDMATRKQLYDFVVAEITAALPQLSEVKDVKMYGRFNKWAAYALLANVYLNAQVYTGEAKWSECMEQCDQLIGQYTLEPNYPDIFKTANETSTEIIFAIPFDETLAQAFNVHMVSWHGGMRAKRNMQSTPYGCGSAKGITQFIDTYDEDDERLAASWLMGRQFSADGQPLMGSYDLAGEQINLTKELPNGLYTTESAGYRVNKFEVKLGARDHLSNDFPFFRYAQILLMKAECLLRTGDAATAAALVSQVRVRAFKSMPAKATVTADQLSQNSVYNYGYVEDFQLIDPGDASPVQYGRLLDELGYEFAWEGYRRRDDIRFGVFTKKSWLSHKPNGEHRTIFPIPQAALNSNPKLKQNPGY